MAVGTMPTLAACLLRMALAMATAMTKQAVRSGRAVIPRCPAAGTIRSTAGGTAADGTEVHAATADATIVGAKVHEETMAAAAQETCTVASHLATSTGGPLQVVTHRLLHETAAWPCHHHYLPPMIIGRQTLWRVLLQKQEVDMQWIHRPNGPDHNVLTTSTSRQVPLPLRMRGACRSAGTATSDMAMQPPIP